MAKMRLHQMLNVPVKEVVKAYFTMTGVTLLEWKIDLLEKHLKVMAEDEAYHHSYGIVQMSYIKRALEHFKANLKEVTNE